MQQSSYKILAEHFADKTGLYVEFVPGACPSTDGKSITLPTEVNETAVDGLLGAVLHETAHVKHTVSPYEVFINTSEFFQACINGLEDIRVDYLTSLKYPNSFDFIRELTQRVIDNKTAQLLAEPFQVQVLKALILKAEGFDPKTLYKSAETLAAFDRCEHYIAEARACADTWATVKVARRLMIDLIDDEAKKEELNKEAGKAEKAFDQLQKKDQEFRQARSERGTLRTSADEKYKQLNNQYRAKSRLETDLNNTPRVTDRAKELIEKIEGKQRVIETMNKDYQAAANAANAACDAKNKASNEFYQAQDELKAADQAIKQATPLANNQGGKGVSLGGFDALTKADLTPDVSTAALETKTIDEIIADALIQRKDEVVIDDQGNRLNADSLAEYETAPDKLFAVKETRHDLTKIAFVLDVSGSMGSFSSLDTKMSLAFTALDVLLRAVKGAIDMGAPCDVALYAFGSGNKRVLNSLENYDTAKTMTMIKQAQNEIGGGTCLLDAVNTVSADLTAEAEKRTMIIITDAEIEQKDTDGLLNKTSGDCKQIYIAIQADMSDTIRELFGRNNITNAANAMDIIGQALYQAI